MALRIEDYGVIGDCETAALVGKDGSIDWLCWPHFSADACFAALLGDEGNGRWLVAPVVAEGEEPWVATWRYLPKSLILETTWTRGEDEARVTDFMPSRDEHSHLVRKVECVRGRVPMHMELVLRFDYGRSIPWVTSAEDTIRAIAGPHMVLFRSPMPTYGKDRKTMAEFALIAGESVCMTLSYAHSAGEDPPVVDAEGELIAAVGYWNEWTSQCNRAGKYTEAVERSLITLKALTYRPTGGVVAAVTTSLPEQLGGPRNWDYRYCWLRDSTFTLLALMNGGFYKEAEGWQDWLLRAIAGSPEQVQIMYGIGGERQLLEWEVPWLEGYEGSKPVRVGNAAAEQLQLDIYGEVLGAFSQSLAGIKEPRPVDLHLQELLVDHLLTIWQEPDQGIWEARSGPQQYTYSKVMVWVAFDRAIRIAEQMGVEEQKAVKLDAWRQARDQVHQDVCEKGFNKKVGAFTQFYGSDELDSSLLLLALSGFLPPEDPRIKSTVEAIEQKLMRNGLLLRYDTGKSSDGLPEGEGSFLACSFWLVGCLNLIGRREDAYALLDRLLLLRSDLGLMAEEYDTAKKRQVGNFPQAFSHIAMINAIFELEDGETLHKLRDPEVRVGTREPVGVTELDPEPSKIDASDTGEEPRMREESASTPQDPLEQGKEPQQ
ncbi:glycoside hydrolase family 15 protein [Acidipila sp. EB88]|uniref:glycoside hydrolase family 15 protein n=1 Tax=Acidipila sp. EB88 TaxID=2305226 RepID=UPI000F5D8E85|nr:glycoside hydrolase family 15 protein [Acidipila sp. EB88]RRA47537.1 glycoside hydrolase family 15 protein [Acidipila sp. EB88]